MTLGEGDELLKHTIHSLIAQDRRQIVLDLDRVPYVDSAGLGEIVRTYTVVSRQGGRLVYCRMTKRIVDLLSITKLLTLFDVFDTVGEAVKSFGVTALEVSCPVCHPRNWMACSRDRLLSCPICDVRFSVSLSESDVTRAASSDGMTTRVSYLWWQTYYENGFGHEQVQLKFGRPCTDDRQRPAGSVRLRHRAACVGSRFTAEARHLRHECGPLLLRPPGSPDCSSFARTLTAPAKAPFSGARSVLPRPHLATSIWSAPECSPISARP